MAIENKMYRENYTLTSTGAILYYTRDFGARMNGMNEIQNSEGVVNLIITG